jgi:hypothetical protein
MERVNTEQFPREIDSNPQYCQIWDDMFPAGKRSKTPKRLGYVTGLEYYCEAKRRRNIIEINRVNMDDKRDLSILLLGPMIGKEYEKRSDEKKPLVYFESFPNSQRGQDTVNLLVILFQKEERIGV